MLKRTLKHLAVLLLLTAVLAPASANAQATAPCTGTLAWTGIVPDCLSPGASYRILFVTSGARDSSSSDIAVYNTFVQAQADGATGTPFSGITFNALGSTPSTNARDNTGTNPNSDGVGERIFYYLGEQVADNYADLYNGDWDSINPLDETGSPSPTVNSFGSLVVRVYTGSGSDGTSATGRSLGDANSRIGLANQNGQSGTLNGNTFDSDARSFYALSTVLTAPGIPEDTVAPTFDGAASIDNQVYVINTVIENLTLPAATGGDGALSYTISPTLPNFLVLTGRILSGNPVGGTTVGITTYTYRVGDRDTNTANTDTATLTFTIEFLDAIGTPMFSSTATIPAQTYDMGTDIGNVTLPQGYGGRAPLSYSIMPTLPNGLILTGRILTGTPTVGIAQTAYTYRLDDDDANINDFSTLPFTIAVAGAVTTPTATLAGSVTEANLFAATAPTVTVTLTGADYVAAGDLMPDDFTVTDTLADGTVSITGVARTGNRIATLTLGYDRVDIPDAGGMLSVMVRAAGHTGTGDLATNTIPITASTGENVCGRTEAVRNEIVTLSTASECTSITDLATIDTLDFSRAMPGGGITALQPGDFAGLTGLRFLRFNRNSLTTLPADIFAGLSALEELNLFSNTLNALPPGVFAGLTSVQSLFINMNAFTSLPVGIFDELDALENLALHTNPSFTPGTGLPAGIFDEVLDTLGTVAALDMLGSNGLSVAPVGRDAHFVCSRADVAAIVTFASAAHCLRVTAAQFNGYLASIDATLSGLTLSAGTLDQMFDSATTAYTVNVANGISSVTVTPTATNASGATITVNGDTVTSGIASGTIDLPPPGTAVPITIIVTAADGTTTETYTVTATRLVSTTPAAALAGTLTEANLFAATAPTVTVTLTNTQYAATGTLTQSHFTVADDVAGTVSVSGFNRDSNTVATLTLAYDNVDITTNGMLSVTLDAAGHTGTGALMTNTIPITASTGTNVCGRTAQVRDEIVMRSSATECTSVDLATVGQLRMDSMRIMALRSGDFAGLTEMTILRMGGNGLTTLPADIFVGLSALTTLLLNNNQLGSLDPDIFDGLSALATLRLNDNRLTTLPADIFVGLNALGRLSLSDNLFTAGTGLPEGIFDDVLNTVTTVGPTGFTVDQNVRDAHFVCSRDDSAAIVTFTSAADCLLVTAAQFDAYNRADATLSGLTLSSGTLNPAFDSATTAYTVNVANSISSVTVTPTATNAGGATITVNGDTVTSGIASGTIDLPPPGTAVPITIIVTAADTTTMMTYTVTATRAAGPPTVSGVAFTSTGPYALGEAIEVTVTFSENVIVTDIPAIMLTINGISRAATYTSGSNSANLVFIYTVPAGETDGNGVGIDANAITTPGSSAIQNAGGTDADLTHDAVGQSLTHRVDTAAPTLSAATVNGNSLVLTYNENLGSSSTPANNAYTIAVSGGGTAPTVTGTAISGAVVTLTLSAAVTREVMVTVSYAPGSTPLRDIAGNAAAGLNTRSVTNDTPAPANMIYTDDVIPDTLNVGDRFSVDFDINHPDTSGNFGNLWAGTSNDCGLPSADGDGVIAFTPPVAQAGMTCNFVVRFVDSGDFSVDTFMFSVVINAVAAPTATLAGTLTEANLFAATAPTVTVTLANTAYEAAPGTLMPSHFSVTDTVAGTVSVSDFTRDSNTVATLTLAYTTEDITADGMLSVTLDAAGHTGTGALMTDPIDITASAGMNICDRTPDVRDEIARQFSAGECTSVGDLSTITRLDLDSSPSTTSLQSGDFAGLTELTALNLGFNTLNALPDDIFAGLSSLITLDLSGNFFTMLPANIFDGLSSLETLELHTSRLLELNADIFDGLSSLRTLSLQGNTRFREDDGLPVGIFDDLLAGALSILSVDDNVRDAHFVCSRDDADAIVAATDGVDDCLRISSTQLNTAEADATLSGLTLSSGILAPPFATGTTIYTVSVADSVTDVTVMPTATNAGATITVNGDTVTSGAISNAITLTAGTPRAIPIVVTAADGTTTQTYTVTVTHAAPPPTATLAGTLTETNLFAGTATVTVTLANTAYAAAPGTLMPSHFSLTDTVAGTVRVSGFTRDSATVVTLTLAYSGEDITTAGTLSVTVVAAGHTGAGDLITNTIPITDSVGMNICGRTPAVRDEILSQSSAVECTSVTDLASIEELDLRGDLSTSLGLSRQSSTSPGSSRQRTAPLQDGDFDGLRGLLRLFLANNALEALPADIFVDLVVLDVLDVSGNRFTPETGLPVGTFDSVLNTLTVFTVDDNVRAAHFACSHPAGEAIVDATVGVVDCVRLNTAEFNAAIPQVDPTLSGLTLSAGTLTPTFAFRTTTYTASVSDSFSRVTVTPIASQTRATITVNAAAVTRGSASDDITLMDIDIPLDISIVVTSADTTNSLTYTVIATRVLPPVASEGSSTVTEGEDAVTITLGVTGTTAPVICTTSDTLPGGLTLNREACTITGDVDDDAITDGSSAQVFVIGYTATNLAGVDSSSTYTLTVNALISSPAAERTAQLNAQILSRVFLSVVDGGNQLIAERLRNGSAAMSGGGGGSMSLTGDGGLLSPGVLKQAGQWLAGDTDELPWRDWVGGLDYATDGSRLGLSPGMSLYANGNYTRLSGDGSGGLDWDGALYGGRLGVDTWVRDDVLVGISASYFRGEFDYADESVTDGEYDMEVSSLHPYIGWSLSEDLDVWASGGYGIGDVELKDDDGPRDSNLHYGALSLGANGRVYASDALLAGGTSELRLRADGTVARVAMSRDAPGFEDVDSRRGRLALEASHTRNAMRYGSLRTGLELGLRHDAGDGQSGEGLEVGGSVEWRDAMPGLTLSGRGRVLTLGTYDEWGISGALRLTPGSDGHGLSFSLSPGYGQENSGIDQLWQAGALGGVTPGVTSSSAQSARMRIDSEVGYGLPLSVGMVRPYLAASLQGSGRTQRMGARLDVSPGMKLNLEGARRERATTKDEHRIQLQWEWSW